MGWAHFSGVLELSFLSLKFFLDVRVTAMFDITVLSSSKVVGMLLGEHLAVDDTASGVSESCAAWEESHLRLH